MPTLSFVCVCLKHQIGIAWLMCCDQNYGVGITGKWSQNDLLHGSKSWEEMTSKKGNNTSLGKYSMTSNGG